MQSLTTFDYQVKGDSTRRCGIGDASGVTQMDPDRRNFGLRMAAARKLVRPKLTQDAVAQRFGVKKATVSAWETGNGLPDALTLKRLAKLYNVSADALLWAESLTPEAMKIAAGYDDLSDALKSKFNAMWLGFYAAASEAGENLPRIANDAERPPPLAQLKEEPK